MSLTDSYQPGTADHYQVVNPEGSATGGDRGRANCHPSKRISAFTHSPLTVSVLGLEDANVTPKSQDFLENPEINLRNS